VNKTKFKQLPKK